MAAAEQLTNRRFRRPAWLVVSVLVSACGSDAPPTGTESPVATSIDVNPVTVVLEVGETASLSATVRDQANAVMTTAAVSWTSDAPDVATVDASGTVSAVGPGSAEVTATSGSAESSAAITVAIESGGTSTLATGAAHSCALDAAGAAYCWGAPASALGHGGDASSTPVPVAGGYAFVDLSISGSATCGLTGDGRVLCWGENDQGQADPANLGVDPTMPTEVALSGSIVQVAAGEESACALDTDGGIDCWGRNDEGQLGRGSTGATGDVGPVVGSMTFAQLTVGRAHACALTGEGQAYCWGRNVEGQVGDGSGAMATTPTAVDTDERFTSLSAGEETVCGVASDRSAYCWGAESNGRLGNGGAASGGRPVRVSGLSEVVGVAAGRRHACALVASGQAHCWGRNGSGELGNGDESFSTLDVPDEVVGGHSFTQISAGSDVSCGAVAPGSVYCWGVNGVGQLGSGVVAEHPVPVEVLGGHDWTQVEAGRRFSCGIDDGGAARCWGEGYGAEGPSLVPGGLTMSRITVGYRHACGIEVGGAAWCWGYNAEGQLGDGSYDFSADPRPVLSDSAFIEIAAGVEHTCALTESGRTYCWGDLNFQRFGDDGASGGGGSVNTPVPGAVGVDLMTLAVSHFTGCGIDGADTAYCWGGSHVGSSAGTSSLPVPVDGAHSFEVVRVGTSHACGVDDAGSAWCWGEGANGRLGRGSTSRSDEPIGVAGGHTFVDIAPGQRHTCALDAAAQVYCWGHGAGGELGDGASSIELMPVAASLESSAVAISSATMSLSSDAGNSCALMTDGRAMCWGSNEFGQVGRRGVPYATEPQAVAPFS